MSVDLVQLGEDIGEAQATAEAALEVAEVASAEAMIAATSDASEDHCGPSCPCRSENAELKAALALLSDKYDEDMEVIGRALDLLLSEGLEEEEPEAEEEAVEVVSPDEVGSGNEDGASNGPGERHGTESATSESGAEGNAVARSSSDKPGNAEEEAPKVEHKQRRRAAAAGRVRFARGRR